MMATYTKFGEVVDTNGDTSTDPVVEAAEETELNVFSLDNTKAELQAELVHRGIDFNQKDNKTELLEKLK